jgi:Flp pilus assembly protein TadG
VRGQTRSRANGYNFEVPFLSARRALPPGRHRERGGTAVEFAFCLPLLITILITIVFGMLEGGRFVVSRTMLSYAVINGARIASLQSTPDVAAVQTAVRNSARLLNVTGINVTVSGGKTFANRTTGDTITVTGSYAFQKLMMSPFGNRTFTARSAIVIR